MARSRAACLLTFSCSRICSSICQPTLYTGLSEVIGSWKIMPMPAPRIERIWSCGRLIRFVPLYRTSPSNWAFGSVISRITVIMVTLLPEPDSPTMPSVSPSYSVADTPSTARTTPSSVRNDTFRLRISSSGLLIR